MRVNPVSSTGELIITNATRAFLAEGYETSIESIAADSGVVRQTVYNLFKSKAGLFRAVVARLITETTPRDLLNFSQEADVKKGLSKLGRDYLALMLNEKALQMHRVMVSQVSLEPELAKEVLAQSGGLLKTRLVSYLEQQSRSGALHLSDADMAAEQFMGMVLGQVHLRATHGLGGESKEKMRQRVEAAVAVFLKAYGAN